MTTNQARDATALAVTANASEGQEGSPLLKYRRIVILTEGASKSGKAKTAESLIRYRHEDITAVLDSEQAGRTCQEVFGAGGKIPIVGTLDDVRSANSQEADGTCDADALFIGIAPAGGKFPEQWRPVVVDALQRSMDVVSGLHDFISLDESLQKVAARSDAKLIDIRRNYEKAVATRVSFPAHNLRVHTVGHDCSVGKMVVAIEVQRQLQQLGKDALFLATGQTGIMVSGRGVPVDAVVGDFVSGSVERLVAQHQEHDILLIEGQGCLTHPSFSGVTLSLLHGCAPQALIMCYEAGRSTVKELPHVPLLPLADLIQHYEALASVYSSCKVIGLAINGRKLDDAEAQRERQRVEDEFGLPACDVYREGPGVLAEAILKYREEIMPCK